MLHLVAFLEVQNTFQFDSIIFNLDAVIFWVITDLKLNSFAFGFKLSQLKGVLDI